MRAIERKWYRYTKLRKYDHVVFEKDHQHHPFDLALKGDKGIIEFIDTQWLEDDGEGHVKIEIKLDGGKKVVVQWWCFDDFVSHPPIKNISANDRFAEKMDRLENLYDLVTGNVSIDYRHR
jgi:hypothetical protein